MMEFFAFILGISMLAYIGYVVKDLPDVENHH